MASIQRVPRPGLRLGVRRRAAATAAVLVARLLSRMPPRTLRRVLGRLSRSARPATRAEATAARDAVNTVSLACRAVEGCLLRSLATAVLCRIWGAWPTWRTGVRRLPPFDAHAWVEVGGNMIGEPYPADYFKPLITIDVPGRCSRRSRS
ncbi:MAG: lasso peptide biosynthesis B2 protein [Streptosporangiaceae bacterium]|nr:lasso peptide biosynthesis B2 protein [Streptosporangiaceae bacterium]MBV9853577.1 lasso peptide biosynthesis B2 protein [Streptosporangiaceae bacterium]